MHTHTPSTTYTHTHTHHTCIPPPPPPPPPPHTHTHTHLHTHCYTHCHTRCLQLVRDHESCNDREQESKKSIQLGDCIKLFTDKEKLSKDDAWLVCTHCMVSVMTVSMVTAHWLLLCLGTVQSARTLCKLQKSLISGSSLRSLSFTSRGSPMIGRLPNTHTHTATHTHSHTHTHTPTQPSHNAFTVWFCFSYWRDKLDALVEFPVK